jgi:hypothetical protein
MCARTKIPRENPHACGMLLLHARTRVLGKCYRGVPRVSGTLKNSIALICMRLPSSWRPIAILHALVYQLAWCRCEKRTQETISRVCTSLAALELVAQDSPRCITAWRMLRHARDACGIGPNINPANGHACRHLARVALAISSLLHSIWTSQKNARARVNFERSRTERV